MPQRLLTANQVAERFNVKRVTVYAAAAQGRIPFIRLWQGKRRSLIRFRSEDIEKLIRDRRFPSTDRSER